MKNDYKQTGVVQPDCGSAIPVLVVFAPTASGKTTLMEKLFAPNAPLAHCAEVVNADSMQVYKDMDIGTAKPNADFLLRVPHKMIDICSPKEQFGVGEFVRQADVFCKQIWEQGKLPVVCGGTAFYIRSFVYGLPPTPRVNIKLREKIANRMKTEGAQHLWEELQKKDPKSAKKINSNDAYRIKRALEIVTETGYPRSYFSIPKEHRKGYNFSIIELERPRLELYERINKRVDELFLQGLEQEVKKLIAMGYTKDDPGMHAIGYREFFLIDDSAPSNERIERVKEMIKTNTRRYAKRQITFFKSLKNIKQIHADNFSAIYKEIVQSFPFLTANTLDQL